MMDLQKISDRFILGTRISSIVPHGSGHINDTYLVTTDTGSFNYILQRINHGIFQDVPGMMSNIMHVTGHLKSKLSYMPGHDPFRETLNLVRTLDGEPYFQDEEAGYWRMFLFIPGMKIYENAIHEGMAREAGRIIGLFQKLLSDLEEDIKDTLPGFHSIHRRAGEFTAALSADPKNRRDSIKKDLSFVELRMDRMKDYFDTLEDQSFPRRIVHYDTKLNNILFDKNDRAVCLIDLDTLCPGYVHFDYGDALRTLANTAPEDEQDLARVSFNKPYYESYTEGYLSEAGHFLSREEIELLPFAPAYLTFLIGLRFLTDYLNGDAYFKVKYPEHNLVRARVQFKLVREMVAAL